MTTPENCICQKDCRACGPSETGCTCPKGKCNCRPCVNAPHSDKCDCRGSGGNCACTAQNQACACESK